MCIIPTGGYAKVAVVGCNTFVKYFVYLFHFYFSLDFSVLPVFTAALFDLIMKSRSQPAMLVAAAVLTHSLQHLRNETHKL